MNAASGLTAQGQSTTNSSLATTFGAEVVDVLPNGMLVVQATRQLTFSQQTQLIQLRGLVRPEDVSAQNQVHVDGHDRSGTGSDGQGHRERLHLPAESAGAAAGEAGGVLSGNCTRRLRKREGSTRWIQEMHCPSKLGGWVLFGFLFLCAASRQRLKSLVRWRDG